MLTPRVFFAHRLLAALLLSMVVAVPTHVQAQAKPDYKPEVGQSGKDVVWVPSPDQLVDKMLDMAKVTPADYLMDLGSGDGRTVIAAAKRGVRLYLSGTSADIRRALEAHGVHAPEVVLAASVEAALRMEREAAAG